MIEKGHVRAPSVKEVSKADQKTNTFDGVKADLFINTGTTGGKTFLVTIPRADGTPILIAMHL
jgi:hypothetical protein